MLIARMQVRNLILVPIAAQFVVLAVSISARAEGFPKPEAVTFLGVEQYAQDARRSVVSIHRRHGTNVAVQPIGSGFLVGPSNQRAVAMVVTCAHVAMEKGLGQIVPANLAIGLLTTNNVVEFLPVAGYRAFFQRDLALLELSSQGRRFNNSFFSVDQLGSSDSIVEGRGVMFIGYPLQRGLEEVKTADTTMITNAPVFRIGIVARRPLDETFLIDGTVSHGNSGSCSLRFAAAKGDRDRPSESHRTNPPSK